MEEDTSSHPYYVRAEFPFVFIPTRDFTFATNHLSDEEQMTSEVLTEKKTDEDEEIVEDEVDQTDENVEEKTDLRISQPKYSQLLRDLDFSQTRMVDVTNLLLSDEGGIYLTADEKQTSFSSSSNDEQNFTNAAREVENDLNHLAGIIQEASQIPTEDDDTSKQATQNYDLNDNEQETISKTNLRFSTGEDTHLSSIPRLNGHTNQRSENLNDYPLNWESLVHGSEEFIPAPTVLIISQPLVDIPTTPIKEHSSPQDKGKANIDLSPRIKLHYRSRQLSSSSDGDSIVESNTYRTKTKQQISTDEDRRSSDRKKSHRSSSIANETWLAMLEKLEQEHKERLERQQKQYEEYMRHLEEKMKQRLDEFLSSSTNLQQSRSDTFNHSIDSQSGRNRTSSMNHQYRPLARDLNLSSDLHQSNGNNTLSRTHSREDISNLRTELSTKHAKHISDLKSYYEDEIDQLNRSKMGHTSSTTRQSMETIERINQENIRLHEEMKDIRLNYKKLEDENRLFKRQIDEFRDQLKNKDLDLKNSHQELIDLEQQLNEARLIKDRQDEQLRHIDRQALHYKEENEKLTSELNLTRERLHRLEERSRDVSGTINENNHQRIVDDLKMNSTMSMNVPTSREYGRFTLMTSKYSSSTVTTPRENIFDSGRLGADESLRRDYSPRSLKKISDYINHEPSFTHSYIPPRPLYSPRKSPVDQVPARDFIESQMKHSEDLEEKFDKLLKTKRDLESRINRIPTRGLTNTDRQLLEVLEREIDRVEQQISSVKLELRKMNILRTH